MQREEQILYSPSDHFFSSYSLFSSFLLYLALFLVNFSIILSLFYIHACFLSTGGHNDISNCIRSVQSLSHVWLLATPLTAACQAFLSITNCRSLLKLMSFELVMPSSYLILCCPLLLLPSIFPSTRSFPRSQFFASGGQSIGVSGSASVLPTNIQDWFPIG